MPSSESTEHKKIKQIVLAALTDVTGASLNEFQSSGHELDVYGVTLSGVTIGIEIIWSPSMSNFIRDMNLILTSDAKIKLVIANPLLVNKKESVREFAKISVAQRRSGVVFFGEMIDGGKILTEDKIFLFKFKEILNNLLKYTSKEESIVNINQYKLPDVDEPIEKKEELTSNLFKVSVPEYVYISETYVSNKPEAYKILGPVSYAYLIKNKKLITFDDLTTTQTVFESLVVGDDIKKISYKDYITDENNKRDYINLLNISIRLFLTGDKITCLEHKNKMYICNLINDQPQLVKWRSDKIWSTREVARPLFDSDTKEIFAYLHYACKMDFVTIDENIYWKLEPSFYFSVDQYNEINKKTRIKLNTSYIQKQYNESYYNMVRFWAKYISRLTNKIVLSVGSQQKMEINALPSSVRIDRGYQDD